MKTALIASLLAMLASPAAAAGANFYFNNESWQSAAVRKCYETAGGTEKNTFCAEAEYALHDARLNKAYSALRALKNADEKDSFQVEERDWIAYKTKFCNVRAVEDERQNPGLGGDYYVLLCTAQITSIRASELEYALTQVAN